MLDFLVKFPDLLHSAIVFGTVIMFGALGEIITEKSGNLNLGVPGIMYFGGIAGLTSTFMYENVYCANAGVEPNAALCVIMCLVASFLASALGGLIYSFLTISLRTNQNVTGLTLTILGSGVGNFFGGSLNKLAGGVGQVSVAVTSQAFRNYSYSLVNFFDGFTGRLRLGTLLFSYGFFDLRRADPRRCDLVLPVEDPHGPEPARRRRKIPPRLTPPVSTSQSTSTSPPASARASRASAVRTTS